MDFLIFVGVVIVAAFLIRPDLFEKVKALVKKPQEKPAEAPVEAPKPVDPPKPVETVAEAPKPPQEAPKPPPTFAEMISAYAGNIQRQEIPTHTGEDYFAKFPKQIPNFFFGEIAQRFPLSQAIVTIGPKPVEFSIFVPEGYNKSVYFDLTPKPGDSNGDAVCTFVIKDFQGNAIFSKVERLDALKVDLSGSPKKGQVGVSAGTYHAHIVASKDCLTLFHVTEH